MLGEENPIDVSALAALGPERLAALLVDAAMMSPSMRRRLQFELSAQENENVPETVHRWISDLREQTWFLGAEKVDEVARELEAVRVAIVSDVSRAAPELAPDLMWQFFSLAGTVYERTTEDGSEISRVFDQACADLLKVTVDAEVEPKLFAAKVVSAISSNQYGEYSALIPAIASAQPWALAYVSQVRALLQRLLDDDPPGPTGSLSGDRRQLLQRALRDLDSPSAV
jgi:hypothetical protein